VIVELQIDANAFLAAFREQMKRSLACALSEEEIRLHEDLPSVRYVITGYEVGASQLRRSEDMSNVCVHTGAPNIVTPLQVYKPQLVQAVVVHVVPEDNLIAANTTKSTDISLNFEVVFELGIDTCGDQHRFCITGLGLTKGYDQTLSDLIAQKLPSKCIELPVDRVIADYMPKDVELVNAHLSLNESRTTLAIRMEYWDAAWGSATGDPARVRPYWESFYRGHFIDRLRRGTERDGWSIFIDRFALESFVRQTITESVSGKSDLTITRPVSAEWRDYYLVPGITANSIHASLEIRKTDACWCVTEDLDVTAGVVADVVLSVPADNTLRTDVWVEVSPDFWDAACCALTAFAFWPILGTGQAIKGKIEVWEYYLAFLPFVSLIGAIIEIGNAGSDFPPPKDFQKDPDHDEHVFREQLLPMPDSPDFGRLVLRDIEPVKDPVVLGANGPRLFGALEVDERRTPQLADPVLEPFVWGKGGRCSRRVAANTNFRLWPVDPADWALLQVCEVRKLDDPFDIFDVRVERELHGLPDVFVSADYWGIPADYWKPEHRYPCRIMIKTTGGVRVVTLPPLVQLSDTEFDDLYLQTQFEFVNECYYPRQGIFDELEWPIEVLVDRPGLHNWQIRAAGLPPGEELELVVDEGRPVARFTVNPSGTLYVDALSQLGDRASAPRLRRAGTHQEDAPITPSLPEEGRGPWTSSDASVANRMLAEGDSWENPSRGVSIRQTALVEAGNVALAGVCQSLTFDWSSGTRCLVVVTEGLIELFDAANPDGVRLVDSWRSPGVEGALRFGNELVAWGRPGIWKVTDESPGPASVSFSAQVPPPVRAAVQASNRLFVLQDDLIVVYDVELGEISRAAAPGADQLIAVDRYIVARSADGLSLFDSRDDPIALASFSPLLDTVALQTVPFALGRPTFFARGQESGTVFQLSKTYELQAIAEYIGNNVWFEGMHRAGDLLVELSDDRRSLALWHVQPSYSSE
jgi:hypothetical protein